MMVMGMLAVTFFLDHDVGDTTKFQHHMHEQHQHSVQAFCALM